MSRENHRKVILISGPAGSGKTSTAREIGGHPNWTVISEDDYWVKIKQGHPITEQRTPEEEKQVQAQALDDILKVLSSGNNVVVEFILYQSPPQPIIFYREELMKRGVEVLVRLLKPSADTIMARKIKRGNAHDQDEKIESRYAAQQLGCLNSDYFEKDWVIDNTQDGVKEVYRKHFMKFVED